MNHIQVLRTRRIDETNLVKFAVGQNLLPPDDYQLTVNLVAQIAGITNSDSTAGATLQSSVNVLGQSNTTVAQAVVRGSSTNAKVQS